MRTLKKLPLFALLLICCTLYTHCGTEIGNPLGIFSSGDNGQSATANEGLSGNGLTLGNETTDCTTLATYSAFTNSSYNYTLPVPTDWNRDDADLAAVFFSSNLVDKNSSLLVNAEPVQSSIGDLLTYISSTYSSQSWTSAINAKGITLVINTQATSNGGTQQFELYATQGLTLLHISIDADDAGNGTTLTSCMVNHLEFL